jgi:hypothetical protein
MSTNSCETMEPEARYGDRKCSADRPVVKHPDFNGEVIAELERLLDNDTVRVIDGLAVHKDAAGWRTSAT